jgi:hypothetical protein
VARQKEPFRKCCCCFESLFISLLGRKTASSTTFEILPTWLAAGAAWHTSSVGPRKTDARLSHTFQTPVSVGCMLVAVGDTEPPPTLVQTLSLGRERWGESMAVAWQALHRGPRRPQISNGCSSDAFKREIFDNKILSCYT